MYFLNQSVASLRRVPFELYDSTGAPITSSSVSFTNPPASGEVQISKAGGGYVNVAGSVVEIGSGSWYYQATIGDMDTLGIIILKVNKSSAQLFKYKDDVINVQSSGGSFSGVTTKTQFVSTEDLQIIVPPFVNSVDGSQYLGTDVVTLVIKRPNGTLLPSPPTPIFDTDIKLWTTTITSASFASGNWLVLATSNGASTKTQNQVLVWGDYVNNIQETHQAAFGRWRIDASSKKLLLYKEDGITILKTFDLKDSTGIASVTQIFERVPE